MNIQDKIKEQFKEQKNLSKRRAEILLSSFIKRNTEKTNAMLKVIAKDIKCNIDELDFSLESQKFIFSWLYKDAKFDKSPTKDELPDWCQYKPYFLIKLDYCSQTLWKIDFATYYLGKSLTDNFSGDWSLFELLGARGNYNGRWEPIISANGNYISPALISMTANAIRNYLVNKKVIHSVPLDCF